MSRKFDEYYFNLPQPVREAWFEEPVDYFADDVEWRPIWGYPGYFVSRYGEVLSMKKENTYTLLKTWPNQYGHQMLRLKNEFGEKCFLVHRLVAEAFLPNLEKLPVVMHKDDDPTNNEVENLKWGTQKDNMQDCYEKGRYFKKPVYCLETDKEYISGAEAADDLQVDRSAIAMCCEGKIHSIKGYHLCYAEDKELKLEDETWKMKSGTFKPVKAISVLTHEELYFLSRKDAAQYLDMSIPSVCNVIVGRTPYAKGWFFKECSYEEGKDKWIIP